MQLSSTKIYLILLLLVSNVQFNHAQETNKAAFKSSKLSVEERIDNLLNSMTLEEKVNALSTNPEVPRLGVEGTGHVEGLHGLALGGPAEWGGKDRPPLPTTTFPQAYGLGETWDINLLERVARAEGKEARFAKQFFNRGALVVRAPNADLARDPRWGRTEESFGEDPFLTGSLTVAFAKGLQSEKNGYWQTASLMKHFLANSNEDGRTYTSSDFDERLMHEYYAVPFRMGITKGGSNAYMAAYNKINGIPAMVHPILKELSQKTWGQNGIICTDGGAFKLLLSDHKYYEDKYKAAAAAIKARISQFLDEYSEAVYGALANGYLTEKDLDNVLRGNYRVMIKLGLLDSDQSQNPYGKIGTGEDSIAPWKMKEHRQLALEATRKSIVLLKNDSEKQLLPLNENEITEIAIIGSKADKVLLDWYSGTPPYTISVLQALKDRLKNKVELTYAKNNADGKAVKIASEADVALVIVGNDPTCGAGWADCPVAGEGKEAVDRQSLQLQEEDLIKLVYKANSNTVVGLISSFPYAINWTQENVPSILHLTQNSQELGTAFTDVLFGDYNPAGRLTQTWVKDITDLPPLMDYNIRNGRTYRYFEGEPLYAFGHGLSYSNFEYKNLEVSRETLSEGETIYINFLLTNKSDRQGEEVAQLYISHLNSAIDRPLKELKAFQRIDLRPGETTKITMTLKAEDLEYWNTKSNSFQLEENQIEIQVGRASNQIYLTKPLNIKN